jgi:hypothetical protein
MVLEQTDRGIQREAQMKRKFSVTYVMEVDEDNNFLSAHEESHREDVHDLVNNVMHDVDDIRIQNLVVKER